MTYLNHVTNSREFGFKSVLLFIHIYQSNILLIRVDQYLNQNKKKTEKEKEKLKVPEEAIDFTEPFLDDKVLEESIKKFLT